jgi:DNA-binding protein WhiA
VITKNELARVVAARECCRLAELAALVKMDGTLQLSSGRRAALNIVTENAAVARKVFSLFKDIFGVQTEILVSRKIRLRKNNIYLIRVAPHEGALAVLVRLGMVDQDSNLLDSMLGNLVQRDCCRRAYLRGAFLGGGSVNSPEGTYHLEIVTNNQRHARDLARLMKKFNLSAKVSYRKNWYVVYLKESEQIVSCLNIMGAHTALLNFENIRVYKDVRNNVNRLVNCETANLNKTVDASVRQIESINIIAKQRKLAGKGRVGKADFTPFTGDTGSVSAAAGVAAVTGRKPGPKTTPTARAQARPKSAPRKPRTPK